jgi:hypothetical protein
VSETIDTKDVERIAKAMFESVSEDELTWEEWTPAIAKDWWRHISRAAIRAMQPAPLPVVRFKDGDAP